MSWIYKEEGYNEHPSAIAAPRPSLMPERMSATVAPSRANSLSQDLGGVGLHGDVGCGNGKISSERIPLC